jgi:hypothetical protein
MPATQDSIRAFLTEQARRVHIQREVLQRQQLVQQRTGAASWAIESTAREISNATVVEQYLTRQLRELPGGPR